MIIKTPRSILFALEYFLKFSPDNGAIRVSGRAAPLLHPAYPRPFIPLAFPSLYVFASRRNSPRC